MSAPIAQLAWDSAFFGFPIARVAATRLDPPALEAALHACRAQGVRCAYLLLDADDAHGSALAQSAGFVVRDVRVTLERPLEASPAVASVPAPAAVGRIGPAHEHQHAALEALARDAFPHTRFTADPGFPPARCRDLYAAFLRRSLDGGSQRTTLADADAGGFAICHSEPQAGVGTIELLAVAASQRERGLGVALAEAALGAFARSGLQRASMVTQAANVASQRLFQRMGFRTRHAGLWLHRWFE
jgi:dTDP-4-amino-4,6-dideoxy-D-galactose acyltransferase